MSRRAAGSPEAKSASTAARGRRLTVAKGLRFECRRCGDCCRDFPVPLSPAEAERYEGRDWSDLLGEAPPPIVQTVRRGRAVNRYLARQSSGARAGECLFLAEDSSCRLHARYGEADKPLACRIFPFAFVAGEGEARPVVGAQFACSSIAAGDGAAVAGRRKPLEALWSELEELDRQREAAPAGERPFAPGLAYSRAELDTVLDLTAGLLEDPDRPFPYRALAAAKFLRLLADSRFPSLGTPGTRKAVRAFAEGVHNQVGRDLLRPSVPAPGPLPQRLLFRMLLAFAARRDTASLLTAGLTRRSSRRLGNLLAGLGFLAGSGAVTPVGRERRVILGEVRRQAPVADLQSPEADGALTRYFLAKLTGRFLLDEGFAMRAALPALGLLLRQLPIIILFARAACYARGGEALTRDDWACGLRTADWNFGRIGWDAGPLGGLRGRLLADLEAPFALLPWVSGVPEEAPAAAADGSADGSAGEAAGERSA